MELRPARIIGPDAEFEAFLVELAAGIPAWQRDAACVEHPEVNFFVDRGESSRPAKAVCAGCLVRDECFEYAVQLRIKEGVWGGLNEPERRRVRGSAQGTRSGERAA
jgi:WhiB family redox-sensing transcriptional regulator